MGKSPRGKYKGQITYVDKNEKRKSCKFSLAISNVREVNTLGVAQRDSRNRTNGKLLSRTITLKTPQEVFDRILAYFMRVRFHRTKNYVSEKSLCLGARIEVQSIKDSITGELLSKNIFIEYQYFPQETNS